MKFLIQNGIIIIPKTTHKERMRENIDLFDFMLTDDDLREIRQFDTGRNVTGWPSDALKYNPDGKKRLTDVIQQRGVESLAKAIPNNQATAFLDWFTYSDNTIDGRSKKKAYTFIESNLVADKDVGTVKAVQQIHAYLFGGLYDYAGRIRTKTIAKGNTLFCLAEHLHSYLKTVETMPENTFDEIVDKYVEMNAAHPFMEGNGRSTRIWLDLIFKKRLNLCVDWSQINKREYLDAMIASHTDSSRIHELLKGALTDKIDDREIFMKGIDYSYYYEQEE